MGRVGRVVALCAAMLILSGVTACAGKDAVAQGGTFQFVSPGGKTRIDYAVDQRKPVGNLVGPDLLQPDRQIKLADFRGKVVVINIWGEWCPPCREEMPLLVDAAKQYQSSGASFLGVNVRDAQIEVAQDFYRNFSINFPSLYDPAMRSLIQLGGVPSSAIPTTLVLDRQGRVASVFLGKIRPDAFLPVLDRVLKEPA